MPALPRITGDRKLQSSLVSAGAAAALVVVVVAALVSWRVARRYLEVDADRRLSDASQRTAVLVAEYLGERRRQLELLGVTPQVVAAAEAGEALANSRGLPMQSTAQAEAAMITTRSLEVDPTA